MGKMQQNKAKKTPSKNNTKNPIKTRIIKLSVFSYKDHDATFLTVERSI